MRDPPRIHATPDPSLGFAADAPFRGNLSSGRKILCLLGALDIFRERSQIERNSEKIRERASGTFLEPSWVPERIAVFKTVDDRMNDSEQLFNE